MHRTTLLLPDGLRERINRKANELGIAMAGLVRQAMEEYLDRLDRPCASDPLANSSFVVREPGPADVSANVDRYLYGNRR